MRYGRSGPPMPAGSGRAPNLTVRACGASTTTNPFGVGESSCEPARGVADVRPAEAGGYLRKIECFCFNEQIFAAGESRELGVRFFIEPDLPQHISTITLSYTLFLKPEEFANNQ